MDWTDTSGTNLNLDQAPVVGRSYGVCAIFVATSSCDAQEIFTICGCLVRGINRISGFSCCPDDESDKVLVVPVKELCVGRKITLFLCAVYGASASAEDLTLSVGHQFNSDFEIVAATGDPPGVTRVTGLPGDPIAIADSTNLGLALDFVFNGRQDQRIGFYLSQSRTEFEDNAGLVDRDLDVTHVHFTAMSYYPRSRFEPFVIAGVGAAFFAPRDAALRDITRLSAQLGVGSNYRMSDSLLLRFDLRWVPTFFNGNSTLFCDGECAVSLRSESYSQFQANAGLMVRF